MADERLTIPAYDEPGRADGYDKRPGTTRSEFRILARLLAGRGSGERVLDVPCGRGRFVPLLRGLSPARLVGADGSCAMLSAARDVHDLRVVADAGSLPFPDQSFDVLVCMRLLHHFPRPEERIAILRELARVSANRVLFSYYESRTLEGMRRRWRRKRPSPRVGIPEHTLREEVAAAGLAIEKRVPLLPLVREQTLVLAVRAG